MQASKIECSDTEDEDHPLGTCDKKEFGNPARPFYQNIPNLEEIIVSMENSEEEDYHMVTGANGQTLRQNSQNLQGINDTTGSHADQKTSTLTEQHLNPVNQNALEI